MLQEADSLGLNDVNDSGAPKPSLSAMPKDPKDPADPEGSEGWFMMFMRCLWAVTVAVSFPRMFGRCEDG